MTALDLSAFAGNDDTPEVAALKAKVQEVATKYAKAHRWCDEVNKALKECGIEPEQDVQVQVETSHGFAFTVKTKPSALNGKSEAKQREVLAGLIGTVGLSAGSSVTTAGITILPTTITTMTLLTSPEEYTAVSDTREGYVWRYVNDQGRVLHLFNETRIARQGQWGAVATLCQPYGATYTVSNLTERSGRGNGDRCGRCVSAGRRDGLIN